jgi:threonine dehydrogenase-like Zn-dependent dehydrogenase
MRGAVLYAPADVRLENRPAPEIINPTDAVIRIAATCVCGSDLWDYRGINPVTQPTPMGHEYAGVVEEVGAEVSSVQPGQFVIGSFFASDGTCPSCRAGYPSSCVHREFVGGGQAEAVRVPLADGTLVAVPGQPGDELIPSLLALSDVMGTGWWANVAAEVKPGATVAVVGDGAVGLCALIAAREFGAGRIIVMSGHAPRQKLALEFGATEAI